MQDIVTLPTHSLICQTYQRYLPQIAQNWVMSKFPSQVQQIEDDQVYARNSVVNADGFGVGWYIPEIDITPGVFTSAQPAVHNRNLQRLASKIRSKLIFAHLRAASESSPVTETNCHPFIFGRFLFMHNGGVARFLKVKRHLIRRLSNESLYKIEGTTDSEYAAALFIDQLPGKNSLGEFSPQEIKRALLNTICILIHLVKSMELQERKKSHKPSSLNFAVTDGKTVVATRFRNNDEQDPPSLYYACTSEYTCKNGVIKIEVSQPGEKTKAVIVCSEPLTYDPSKWTLVPKNHVLLVTDGKVHVEPIEEKDFPPDLFGNWFDNSCCDLSCK